MKSSKGNLFTWYYSNFYMLQHSENFKLKEQLCKVLYISFNMQSKSNVQNPKNTKPKTK